MVRERQLGFWGRYREELRNVDHKLYGGMLQEMGHVMDIIGASRAMMVYGGIGILAGIGVERFAQRRLQSNLLRVPVLAVSRVAKLGGVALVGLGAGGEVFGRKALSVIDEVRQEYNQESHLGPKGRNVALDKGGIDGPDEHFTFQGE